MQLKSLFTVLAAGAVAHAATSTSKDPCSLSTTITAVGELETLNACSTLDGSITITGQEIINADLSGVREIKGDLKFFNSTSIVSLNLNQLQNITEGGSLSVVSLTTLASIDFTSLTNVDQVLLTSLPSLGNLVMGFGVVHAGHIEISDTAINSLSRFVSFLNTVRHLELNSNKNITSIDLTNLNTVTENLILRFNGDDCDVKLDTLAWASNITIQDVGDIEISNITAINGSLVLAYNTFDSFNLDSLKTIGGSIEIFANDELTEFSFHDLETIGGELSLSNNTNLENVTDSFPNLNRIKGAVNIDGGFANFSTPKLARVNGDFSFNSTNEDFSCDFFNKLRDNKDIEGHNYECTAPKKSSSSTAKSKSTSTSESSSDSTSDDSGSSSTTSKKSDGYILVPASMALTTIIGSFLAFIL
ncbi:hypothetical protoplast-secreted beta-1,6-N-acetylglucosaminyltransferase, contains WSC domain (ECM33) [Scheffersomyces stipitis CBS 6054]|uniref:Hypothetical protoplast-secreted beta-1,6-N-acetylglucosaminyltransferase, contains WSC domain (ECM33) n=1 Tax=Scheffersomyces stipitis (strain ATCC 58785 / CBS 6054 / NBRC 10063 / NRRL Y-11545) TaxID=322104 RepID=A3LVQ4_PICST|nr:hypothetical protoplast-secreted beta-1,6-N-acetylglucosaminyltransferase, contains WSC domain (ECM33) [Scheffersomyces stipitis CBS 6054]ABN67160.1 hypothetical protoplast-secreted beta-1,6-N-acetylglucosaminyltransferase, contains WSC domain (ECM33) [Scheffersomyces stipitis CBS 6054]